jgi:hypothetical protein
MANVLEKLIRRHGEDLEHVDTVYETAICWILKVPPSVCQYRKETKQSQSMTRTAEERRQVKKSGRLSLGKDIEAARHRLSVDSFPPFAWLS